MTGTFQSDTGGTSIPLLSRSMSRRHLTPTGWFLWEPNVNAFEQSLADFANSKNDGSSPLDRKVVCLSAGTAAVHLALIGCGVQAGDEVCVQSFTFCASSHPITYLGAKPVFVGSEG